jgi:hypothetical protein
MAKQPIYFSTSPVQFLHPSLLKKSKNQKNVRRKAYNEQENNVSLAKIVQNLDKIKLTATRNGIITFLLFSGIFILID